MVVDDQKPITQKVLFEALLDFFEKTLGPEFEKLDSKINAVASDVSILKNDVSILKKDVSILKNDMYMVKQDLSDLKRDLPANIEIQTLKKRVSKLEQIQATV